MIHSHYCRYLWVMVSSPRPQVQPTFISTHQLLGNAGNLHVSELQQPGDLLRCDWMLPHGRVHCRAEEQRAAAVPGPHHTGLEARGETSSTQQLLSRCGCTDARCSHQQVVTQAAGDLPQCVGVERRDEQQVGPAPQLDVQHRVRALSPQLQHTEEQLGLKVMQYSLPPFMQFGRHLFHLHFDLFFEVSQFLLTRLTFCQTDLFCCLKQLAKLSFKKKYIYIYVYSLHQILQ